MKYFGWIFLFFIMVYIVPLGSRPMLAPQEFTNAETAREMLLNKSVSVPVLLGETDVIMPMNYWLSAGSFKLFGENAFANRLPSALAVGLTALLLALLVQQTLRNEKLAALAAMIYMSSSLVYSIGTLALSTNVFVMFITGASGLFFLSQQEPKFNRRKFLLLLLCGISVGLAFLTKGIIAFAVAGLIYGVFLICKRKWLDLFIIPVIIFIFAALTIAPWGAVVLKKFPDAASIIWQDFAEFFVSDSSYGKINTWYYYLPLLIIGLMPSGLLIPAAGAEGRDAWKKLFSQPLFQFCICALIVPLVFFSAIPVKHSGYTLLCFPSAAILIAAGVQLYFNAGGHHRSYNWVMNIWGFLLLAGGMALIAVSYLNIPQASEFVSKLHFSELVLVTLGIAAAVGGILILYSLRGNWRSRLYLFFFGISLLPLSISWCVKPNSRMPEQIIASVIAENDLKPQKMLIVSSHRLAPAVAWTAKNDQVKIISDEKCCDRVILPEELKEIMKKNGTPVMLVLYSADKMWSQFPDNKNIKTVNEISFLLLD